MCVIGAGFSGLTAVKALVDESLDVEAFEREADIGGNWRMPDSDGGGAMYEGCHLISSWQTTRLRDFPWQQEPMPVFPDHNAMRRYLNAYVDHFDLRRHYQFSAEVTSAVAADTQDGRRWRVTLSDGRQRDYNHLVVATGRFDIPNLPALPGDFDGDILHARQYWNADPFRGKRVVVVGAGNTAADVACEISQVADATWLAVRSGANIVPRFVLGTPFNEFASAFSESLPYPVQDLSAALLGYVGRGRQHSYGLPPSPGGFLAVTPTVSSTLLERVAMGDVRVMPAIDRVSGNTVEFGNGESIEADTILYCTGYITRFPFLEAEVADPENRQVANYLNVVNLHHEGLFFVGLVNPMGAVPPVLEAQSKLAAALIAGNCGLPSRQDMEKAILKDEQRLRRREGEARRHVCTVPFNRYLSRLKAALNHPTRQN